MDKTRYYICIDLKSFFASVECVLRALDPMTTRLVVADPDRSKNTICLAVSPALKKLGVKNRCRVGDIPGNIDYIIARPRMQRYIDYSAEIYRIYLRYFSKDDIHVYSIDEAFMDVTDYLSLYNMTPRELGKTIMDRIYNELGIRATCGIGTNLYLTKVALDISAKHSPDFIGELTEETYRSTLWKHRPLTDFWRVGHGICARLAKYGINTMEDIAKTDEGFLYSLFGVDAELLIDHAWGREPVTIADIKAYRPKTNCLSSGQVLMSDYSCEKGLLIVKEMTDQLCLNLIAKELVTQSITIYIAYSSNEARSTEARIREARAEEARTTQSFIYFGESCGGSVMLSSPTAAASVLVPAVSKLYSEIIDPSKTIRRVNISFNNVVKEEYRQLDFFIDTEEHEKNIRMQQAMLALRSRFGKNSVLKGMNLEAGAMTRERNNQIGGHHA